MDQPTIGRVVWYRSKTGRYTLPADIIATMDKLYRPAVEAGFMPDLDDEEHVHLLVKTAGIPGTRLPGTATDIKADNQGGTYVEHNIPFWDPVDDGFNPHAGSWADADQPNGTWTWPRRSEYRSA